MEKTVNIDSSEFMDEDLSFDLKKVFFSLWNRKTLILKTFTSIFALMVILTFILPKKYEVEADLYINKTNSSNMAEINPYFISEVGATGGMAALMAGNSGNLANDIELMRSSLVIDKVIKENNIKIRPLFGFITTKETGQYVKSDNFKKAPKIEVKKGTNVVTISFKSKNRVLAYNVVSSIIKNYMQLYKELNTEKSKSDKAVLQAEYNSAKASLNKRMNSMSGMPQAVMNGSGNIATMSAFSKTARQAISQLQGHYASGVRSELALKEEADKVSELAKKLEWAKLVENMSDSSKVIILKEPQQLMEYEQVSPKLFTNILLGIIFGIFGALASVIIAELIDKKLTYSKLGDEITYNFEKEFNNFKIKMLKSEKENKGFVFFEEIKNPTLSKIQEFKNIQLIKAEISNEFKNNIEKQDKIVLFVEINKTNAEEYKLIKELILSLNKEIITEVLL